jgi:NAD(P)-dependent dehydrogenase (short-subunit alcohol dehydrogenase family)
MSTFQDRVALVTGGTSGIGRATGEGLGDLSGQPLGLGRRVQQLSPAVAKNQKRRQAIKAQCRNHE